MNEGFLSFIFICIAIELTPGPNMTYLTMVSSLEGRKAGFFMVAGIASGLLIMGLLAAFGGAPLILENPALYQFIRITGVLYLLWLAWDNWRNIALPQTVDASYRALKRGLITNLLNPKAAIFYVTVFPSFIDPHGSLFQQTSLMLIAYIAVATVIHSLIVLLGDRLGLWLRKPSIIQLCRYGFSILLLLVALWFFFATQHPV